MLSLRYRSSHKNTDIGQATVDFTLSRVHNSYSALGISIERNDDIVKKAHVVFVAIHHYTVDYTENKSVSCTGRCLKWQVYQMNEDKITETHRLGEAYDRLPLPGGKRRSGTHQTDTTASNVTAHKVRQHGDLSGWHTILCAED